MDASVIINNHNYGEYLRQCIHSVLCQDTTLDVEIIVVDDGSTDISSQVLSEYRTSVSVVCQDNRGQAAAINRGVKLATGRWIFPLDSDDVWQAGKLQACMEAIAARPSATALQHGYSVIDIDGNETGQGKGNELSGGRLSPAGIVQMQYEMAPTSCLAFRSDVVPRIFPIPEHIFDIRADLYLHTMLATCGTFIVLPQALTFYRVHGRNTYSGPLDVNRLKRDFRLISAFVDWLRERGIRDLRPERSFYYARSAIWSARVHGNQLEAMAIAWKYLRHSARGLKSLGARKALARAGVVVGLLISPQLGIDLFNSLLRREFN